MQKEKFTKAAKLAVRIGVNIQKDQNLVVNSPIECSEFARALPKKSQSRRQRRQHHHMTKNSAKSVAILHADLDVFKEVPDLVRQVARTTLPKKAQLPHLRLRRRS